MNRHQIRQKRRIEKQTARATLARALADKINENTKLICDMQRVMKENRDAHEIIRTITEAREFSVSVHQHPFNQMIAIAVEIHNPMLANFQRHPDVLIRQVSTRIAHALLEKMR